MRRARSRSEISTSPNEARSIALGIGCGTAKRSKPKPKPTVGADRQKWACEEFGGAELGDSRRVARLVCMGAALLAHVAGTITGAFRSPAERVAAYDFLSNAAVTLAALTLCIWNACAKRCADFEWVYVPIDGSSLALTDAFKTRGTGAVGTQEVLIHVGPRQRGAARARQGRAMKPHSLCGESLWCDWHG